MPIGLVKYQRKIKSLWYLYLLTFEIFLKFKCGTQDFNFKGTFTTKRNRKYILRGYSLLNSKYIIGEKGIGFVVHGDDITPQTFHLF